MEILQNTLIQLAVRQGSDSDRKYIVFSPGEPLFTTDTNRFYIGTIGLSGGSLAGNLFKGIGPSITNFSPSVFGDLSFDTNTNTLNLLLSGDGTNINNWKAIANLSYPTYIPVYARYNGPLSGIDFSKNITSASRLSAGHYRFNYGPLPTSNLIPTVQIFGGSPLGYQARTLTICNSSCDVKVLSSDGSSTDAIITLMINY